MPIWEIRVNVGEPMVKSQDYWVDEIDSAVVSPSQTVTLKGGIVNIALEAGQKYSVQGKVSFEGQDYVAVATGAGRYVLVKPDGTLLNRVFTPAPSGHGLIAVIYSLAVSDPSTHMLRETSESVNVTKGYENFELLYTGTNSSAFDITYREFSPEGFARVAFFQNLTYEAGAKVITFKRFRIAVDKVTSESITYTVISDGGATK